MPTMFEFSAEKNDFSIRMNLRGSFSISQVDISLKDICIYLKEQYLDENHNLSDKDGYLKVSVATYNRELTYEEKQLIKLRLLPINQVTIENNGFSFEEIQELMYNIQNQLPSNYKSSFMYSVDFRALTVD